MKLNIKVTRELAIAIFRGYLAQINDKTSIGDDEFISECFAGYCRNCGAESPCYCCNDE